MKKPNITNGEWKYDKLSNTISTTDTSISGDIVVDEAAPKHATDSMQYSEANIKLICAAPDLAEALNELVDFFIYKDGYEKVNEAKAILFKHCPELQLYVNTAKESLLKAGYTERIKK